MANKIFSLEWQDLRTKESKVLKQALITRIIILVFGIGLTTFFGPVLLNYIRI